MFPPTDYLDGPSVFPLQEFQKTANILVSYPKVQHRVIL